VSRRAAREYPGHLPEERPGRPKRSTRGWAVHIKVDRRDDGERSPRGISLRTSEDVLASIDALSEATISVPSPGRSASSPSPVSLEGVSAIFSWRQRSSCQRRARPPTVFQASKGRLLIKASREASAIRPGGYALSTVILSPSLTFVNTLGSPSILAKTFTGL